MPTSTPGAAATNSPVPSATPSPTGGPSAEPRGPVHGTSLPTAPPPPSVAAPPAPSSPRPPTPTPTPPPDCGQGTRTEDGAPPGYVSDPHGAQGADHVVYAAALTGLEERDAFRASLPPDTPMGPVNDAIARGCSAAWIRDHLAHL
jgi:hypothetical protein